MSKITHDEARIEAVSYNCESIRVLLKYITQQEKQEKLLVLYKRLLKLEHQDFHSEYKGNSEEYFKEWNATFDKIKELEDEEA